jgi:antitoxin (DNA-binding transcriptional repressor) of toxin-antitoxin stability system
MAHKELIMKFLTVRDLRSKSAQIWKELTDEQEMVITNNGRPVAILSATNESNLETSLNSIRRARLADAVSSIQEESIRNKTNDITQEEIDEEIKKTRKARKR